jgi:hypothetical protein
MRKETGLEIQEPRGKELGHSEAGTEEPWDKDQDKIR